jgi:hypothetical protein
MRNLFLTRKRKNTGVFLVYLFTTTGFGIVVFGGLDAELNRGVQYSCELAEYSSEFTPQMKLECRNKKNKGIVYRYDT